MFLDFTTKYSTRLIGGSSGTTGLMHLIQVYNLCGNSSPLRHYLLQQRPDHIGCRLRLPFPGIFVDEKDCSIFLRGESLLKMINTRNQISVQGLFGTQKLLRRQKGLRKSGFACASYEMLCISIVLSNNSWRSYRSLDTTASDGPLRSIA